MKKSCLVALLLLLNSSCAYLHSTQIGEINSAAVKNGRKFELLISETGFNLEEAGAIARYATRGTQAANNFKFIQNTLALFQMGPKTGNPVFNEAYADVLVDMIKEKCPSGNMSGLMSVRESSKYPVVSGEIVKITGYCIEG